jgi:hypothetical protein
VNGSELTMNNVISGFGIILVGIIVICFRKKFAKSMVTIQNKSFGFHFGDKEIKANEWLLPFFGVLAIVIGILTLFDLFKF